jgi:hypothetical protein
MEIRVADFDLVKPDKKTLDVQKLLLKMWEYKKDSSIISQLANILSKFVDEKRVFADIEFFLPQIAHLTIHLDHANRIAELEYLLILIAQTSIHAALQLSFIFAAALEDFQPEIGRGQSNPNCNPFLFNRCARLLEDVERAVIYGSQTLSTAEQTVLERKRRNSDDPRAALKDVKREQMATSLSRMKSVIDGQLSGDLFYKRLDRKSMLHTKKWKTRYFVVDKRVLSCFHDPHSVNPVRTMHLQNARVVEHEPHPKYEDTVFELINDATNTRFLLRAENSVKRRQWINVLQSQINGAPPVIIDDGEQAEKGEGEAKATTTTDQTTEAANERAIIPAISITEMTPIQRKRFCYFRQLRIFITNMTNICEKLR